MKTTRMPRFGTRLSIRLRLQVKWKARVTGRVDAFEARRCFPDAIHVLTEPGNSRRQRSSSYDTGALPGLQCHARQESRTNNMP